MIVIDKISKTNLLFFKFFAFIGFKFYVYDFKSQNKEFIYEKGFIKKVKFNLKDKNKIAKINYTKYNWESNPYRKYITPTLIRRLNKFFPKISKLEVKLVHIIENIFWSLETSNIIGFIYNHRNNQEKFNIIIHNNFLDFFVKSRSREINLQITHLYFPLDDINKIKQILIKLLKSFFKKKKANYFKNLNKSLNQKNRHYKVGVIYHISEIYGQNLYDKKHFFSDKKDSPLNEKNVISFIVGNDNSKTDSIKINFNDIDKKNKFFLLMQGIVLFIKNLDTCQTKKQLLGLSILSIFYIKYKLWIKYFSEYSIDNIIYDYDVNFSKALSLALSSLSINTISICERASLTTLNGLGVIVDNYIIPGKIYKKYVKKNSSFLYKESINIDFWRLKYFKELETYKLSNKDFHNSINTKKDISSYENKIVILGWNLNSDLPNYFINERANEEFFNIVESLSSAFQKYAVILRMKMLNIEEGNLISERFKNKNNIFLCNNYQPLGLSYHLCKEASLIVSIPTSLAEESVAYGKKVIFIDDLYTIKNISSYLYPKEFKFSIAKNTNHLINLSNRILNKEKTIEENYKNLSYLLKGELENSQSNHSSSIFIEKLLTKESC